MFNIQRFKGNLDNKNVHYFIKQLDHTLGQSERVELVKKILYTQGEGKFLDNFFEEVFEQKETENGIDKSHIRLCLNTTDALSMDDYTCKGLESIANYLLFSPDGERINKKTKYNFYPSEIFEKKTSKDASLESIIDGDSNEEVIDFLIRKGENFKKIIKQKIYKEDEGIDVVNEYGKVIEVLSDMLKKDSGFELTNGERKKIGKIIYDMRDDQCLCKDMVKGTIYFKQVSPDSTAIDYEQFDFSNKEQIIALLKMPPSTNFDNELACLTYDLDILLKKISFTKDEKVLLNLWKKKDSSIGSIAEYLDTTTQYVSKILNSVAKKISQQWWDEYEDWYYLNVVKGRYKTCSKCGQVKLVSKFGKHPNTKDGLYPCCKDCR